ncbi:uncharacterized protein PHACADRAFT_189565 [Phanerochaete carnosa HHB-10118-sp]|uniref:NACHT domain-containing protein n=1 Tax=Phanerochaete carnosa (strain HHB-10118-sp) TaxID=650164 RepID=K5VBY9_PHACS|nr:uncharacterized protein PHACADRAFT_189565 [Phanerochaete carnosa HHB-10118-sp]EKM60431.1 hypothetical protein PHACADRAFT_189565 [Phanerochaete carnosa HHB-10118-sp]
MSPRRLVDVTLDIAPSILELAESALALAPVPGLPLIAKGLGFIVVRENSEELDAFLAQAKELEAVIERTIQKAETVVEECDGNDHDKKELAEKIKHSEKLQERTRDLLGTIGELQGSAGELKGGAGFCGFFKGAIYSSRNQAVLSDMKKEMAQALRIFKIRGSISIENIFDEVALATKEIQRQLREAEDLKIIESIPWASAGYRSVDELKSGFMQGTRKNLFAELDLWSAGRFPECGPKRFYLLSGGAGMGKSSVTHQLCVRLDAAREPSLRLGASFFFVRGAGDLESTSLFFSTFARQLALSRPVLRPYIISAAREYLQHGERQQMHHTFQELLRKALTAAPVSEQVPTLLVVDGMDECKDRALVPDLLRYLLELVRELPWLHVFAASRPEPHILSVLASPGSADLVHHRRLDDTLMDGSDDVKRYLSDVVPKIPSYADFLRKHPDALERLARRAGGLFIFARIVVNFFDTIHDHPEEQFELVLSGGGTALSPLDALYLQILRSAFPPETLRTLPARHKRLLSLLRFVALARHPPTPETIAFYARGLSLDDVFTVVDHLRSVLLVNMNGRVVPLHASFCEFLVDEGRCSDALYHVNSSEGHAYLATAFLASSSFENYAEALVNESTHVDYLAMKIGWREHLKQAKHTADLEAQLSQFVHSIQLALYLWFYKEFEPRRKDYRIRCIWNCLQPCRARTAICSEFLKFGLYIELWQSAMLNSPGLKLPRISSGDIIRTSQTLPSEIQELLPNLDLTVESDDLIRYQAIMKSFMTEIMKQDERARSLWCLGLDM